MSAPSKKMGINISFSSVVYLSVCPSVGLSICLSVCLSVKIACLLYIIKTHGGIFKELNTNDQFDETMCRMYVVFIVWMGVKHTHSNFGVARFLRITLHLMQFITYSLYFRGMVRM